MTDDHVSEPHGASGFARLRGVYPPVVGAAVAAVASLIVVEVSEGWDRNRLGFLVADGFASVAVGLAALTLIVGAVARFRAASTDRTRPVSRLGEWIAIIALALAAIAHANALENSGDAGWTNYPPNQISDHLGE